MSAPGARKAANRPGAVWAVILVLGLLVSRSEAAEPPAYYAEDIKEAMSVHIAGQVDEEGIFKLRDDRTGELLTLKFVKIHDPVRQIDDGTYFACTDFHVVGEAGKLYDIDFWLRPAGDKLKVYDTKVHKEPRRSFLYGWYKYPRYEFVDDKVVPLY
jgi:hypothetical protein